MYFSPFHNCSLLMVSYPVSVYGGYLGCSS